MELAELEVGEVGPAACASTGPAPIAPHGLVVRSHRAAPPPVARIVAWAGIGPVSVTTPAQAESSLQSARADVSSRTSTRVAGGDERREAAGQRSAGLAAAGVDDPARRVTALEAERRLAGALGVESHALRKKPIHRGGRLLDEHPHRRAPTEAAAGGQVSAAWRSGESSAARRPPDRPGPSSWRSRQRLPGDEDDAGARLGAPGSGGARRRLRRRPQPASRLIARGQARYRTPRLAS